MGCIIEFILELFIEGVIYAYISLMTLIVPEKKLSQKVKKRVRTVVVIISSLLLVSLVLGIVFIIEGLRPLGDWLTFCPLYLIALQVVIGIVFRIVSKHRSRKDNDKRKKE